MQISRAQTANVQRASEPASMLPHGRASVDADYSVEQITTEQELDNVREAWNRLSENAESPNVFMTYDWFRAWGRRHAKEEPDARRRLNVLVVKKRGAIVGISPLVSRKVSRWGFSLRKIQFTGPAADYNELVLGTDPSGQSRAIINFLAESRDAWDLVDLRDLRATRESISLVEAALSQSKLHFRIQPEKGAYPFLVIDAPWQELIKRFSPSVRHRLCNQQNRLDRMRAEGLRVRIIENPHREEGLVEKLAALEAQKRVHGTAPLPIIARNPEVFQSLFDGLGPKGYLYVALMEWRERPIAWRLGFRCGSKLWGYVTAFDRAFARLSPGTMLIPAVIDYGYQHGHDEYDLLRGEEAYKMRWATSFHQTFQIQIWNQRWKSRARAGIYLDLKEAVYRRMGKGE